MPDWVIEPLETDVDLDAVMAVEQASFTNPWTREMYQAELGHQGVSFFVLARAADRQVIGFCSFWRVVDEVHINNLAVLPEHRHQGIGRALLARVLQDAAAQRATRALLEVRRSNEPARRLYESLGFVVAGVRRGYYTDPIEDALVLWREPIAAPDAT